MKLKKILLIAGVVCMAAIFKSQGGIKQSFDWVKNQFISK